MNGWIRRLTAVSLWCFLGCSSSSSGTPAKDASPGGADTSAVGADTAAGGAADGGPTSADTALVAADVAAGSDQHATAMADTAAPGGADASPAVDVNASPACVKFCTCMAMNCADKMFPHGCLQDCAAQTNWDLGCREVMCELVPAQPANDHCTHAMGVNQCLDKM